MNRWSALTMAAVLLSLGCPSKTEPMADGGIPVDSGADASPDLVDAIDTGSDAADASAADAAPDQAGCTYTVETPESIPTPARLHTPRWAFLPWISKDISDGPDTYAFVDGFISRDIPVGTVVLDSPWETSYNTFIPNPSRYPDFAQMVADMRDRDVRVVLWVTQLVNQFSFDLETGGDTYDGPASNYDEGVACGFFIDDAKLYNWWKGKGCSVDFYNPVARQWWHEQQAALLDAGIAGWKLDFGDSYVRTDTVTTAAGVVDHQDYSEAYYRDYYEYGVSRLGDEDFLTMVRAYDKSYAFAGRFFARPENAPVVWVGDNRRDWIGLSDALDHIFRSAAAGYTVIGSDLGGYLDRDDQDLTLLVPFDRVNFMRWLAVSAMTPFMQLHGRANLTPWTLPDDPDSAQSVANYRYWAYLHTELVPFWYSLAEETYRAGANGIIRPIGDEASWAGDYRYMLGDALLVAPFLDETGMRGVDLPAGTFYDWWDGQAFAGPTTVSYDFSNALRRIPLLVKRGAIIPISSTSDITSLTEGGLGGADVALAWPDATISAFVVHDESGQTTTLNVEDRGGDVRFFASRAAKPLVVRLRFDDPVTEVTVDGNQVTAVTDEAGLLASASYRLVPPYVWVSSPPSTQGVEIVVSR